MQCWLYPAWKVSKYGITSSPHFPVFGLNTEICGVTPYLDTFYAVVAYFSALFAWRLIHAKCYEIIVTRISMEKWSIFKSSSFMRVTILKYISVVVIKSFKVVSSILKKLNTLDFQSIALCATFNSISFFTINVKKMIEAKIKTK